VQGASCKAHVQCTDCLLYPSIIIYIASYRVTNCKALLAVYQCHTYKVHTSAIQERKQIFFLLSTTLSLQTHISNPIQSNPIQSINMARITSAALAILLCLTSSVSASISTTIIDSTGALTRTSIPQSSIGNGIVAVLSSPGTPSYFSSGDNANEVTLSSQGSVSILSSPGATLAGTSSLSKGSGAAAAASVAGSIIVSGITESDLENGLDDTRHGHTLTAIFKQKIQSVSQEKITLIIAVPAGSDESIVLSHVHAIFDTATAELGSEAKFDDLYDVVVENVSSEADAQRVSHKLVIV
jgi:hypothetical protein